jgi:hypothetical protein
MTTYQTALPSSAASPGPPPRARLAQLLFGFYATPVLHALVELGIPEQLAAAPMTIDDLARATATHAPALRRLLRAAAGLGLVAHRESEVAMTRDGLLLHPDTPGSVRNLVLLWGHQEAWRSWGELVHSVRTGEAAYDHVVGEPLFTHLGTHPEQQAVFNEAMAEITRVAVPGILAACDLGHHRHVTDIGGGSGTLIAAVLAAHPHLTGTIYDLPAAIAESAAVLAGAGVDDRCERQAGDFFEHVPAGADAYLLKSVLHDWDDRRAQAILRRCRAAMADDSVLYVVEPVMPTTDAELAGETFMIVSDLNMLVCLAGAERTEPELRTVLAASGLRLTDVTRCPPPSNLSVLRAVPA